MSTFAVIRMEREGRNNVLPELAGAAAIAALLFVGTLALSSRHPRRAPRDDDPSSDDARLAHLAQHLMRAAETEKAALAAELHTDMGGALSAIALDLAWALKRAEPVAPEVAERLRQAIALVQDASALKRRIVEDLRPSLLEHLGLVPALTDAVRRWSSRTGLPVATRLPESIPGLDHGPALALFRVAQEALANVEHHAAAHRVSVSIEHDDGHVTLAVEDDGIGLAPDARVRPECHGIAAMEQRVAAFGGTLHVAAREGERGTRLVARVPAVRGPDASQDAITPLA